MANERQAIRDLRQALDQKFGEDIVVMDISAISVVADYFVIVTGRSAVQMIALKKAAEEALGKHAIKLRHIEGSQTSDWVLLDFGDIIVHFFHPESRPFYNLERVWGDARIIND